MTEEQVGPFTVTAATPAQVARVGQVAARIPATMVADAGAFRIDFGERPARAPSWAWGFKTGRGRLWVDPRRSATKQLYIIAHEYFHEWDDRHATTAQRNEARALMGSRLGWNGGYEKQTGTNRPAELAADAFARALGFTDGPRRSYWLSPQPFAPAALLAVFAGGGATAPAPFPDAAQEPAQGAQEPAPAPEPAPEPAPAPEPSSPTQEPPPAQPRRLVSLRAWPGLAAPVIRRVVFGGRIRTGVSRIGAWSVLVDGRRGSLWLQVLAVNGKSIDPPLWLSAVELLPQPTPPAEDSPSGT